MSSPGLLPWTTWPANHKPDTFWLPELQLQNVRKWHRVADGTVLCGSLDGRGVWGRVVVVPGWEWSLGEKGYVHLCGWGPSPLTWNYLNIVNKLYPNTKRSYNKKKQRSPLQYLGRICELVLVLHLWELTSEAIRPRAPVCLEAFGNGFHLLAWQRRDPYSLFGLAVCVFLRMCHPGCAVHSRTSFPS